MGNLHGSVTVNRHLRGAYWLLEVALRQPLDPPQPGRFLMLKVSDACDPLLRRPFGIHDFLPGPGDSPRLRILYQVCGRGTRLMTRLAAGDDVDMLGPLGRGFDLPGAGRALVVAGGIGGAPLLYLARTLRGAGIETTVYAGGNTSADLLGRSEFRALGADFREATMDGSSGYRGTVVDLVRAEEERADDVGAVFACGPWPMLRSLARSCLDRGWPMQATVDSLMACGMGLCLGCAVNASPGRGGKHLMVCRDGPVFNLGDLSWEDPT